MAVRVVRLGQPRGAARWLALLAALSRQTNFAVGCYCENEARCHRSILRELLADAGDRMDSST